MNEEKKVRERDEQFLKFKNSQEEKIKWIEKAKDQEIVQMEQKFKVEKDKEIKQKLSEQQKKVNESSISFKLTSLV